MTDQAQTFETFVASERARIATEREKLLAKKSEIDTQLAAIDKELTAITAYENVKAGRVSTPRAASSGSGRRTGQREAVLATVKAVAGGISASDVIATMNAASDADKTSVRNALSALKRNGQVDLKDGKYIAK